MSHSRACCRVVIVPLVLGLMLSACASSRTVVDIEPLAANRREGIAFAKITEVRDLRKFERAPRDPSVASLGDATEINDPALTARVIARKRSDTGVTLGDVVLPEGSTVATLVRSAAQKALQDAGYLVVDETSPNYATALPLSLDVEEFWAWSKPGGDYIIPLEFNSLVTIRGDALVGRTAPAINARAITGSIIVLPSSWRQVVEAGLENLSDKLKDQIVPAVAAAGAAPVIAASSEVPSPTAPVEPRQSDGGLGNASRAQAASMAAPPAVPAQIAPALPGPVAFPPTAPAAMPAPSVASTSPKPIRIAAARPMAATAPPPPSRTGKLPDDLGGRWISYLDAAFTGAPTPVRQQMLLERCAKSYALFEMKGSRLLEDFHRGSGSLRSEFLIASQRPNSLAVHTTGAQGHPIIAADVSLDYEQRLANFGFPQTVLVFDVHASLEDGARYAPRKYARCPAPP